MSWGEDCLTGLRLFHKPIKGDKIEYWSSLTFDFKLKKGSSLTFWMNLRRKWNETRFQENNTLAEIACERQDYRNLKIIDQCFHDIWF
jgi:hypothetical protein